MSHFPLLYFSVTLICMLVLYYSLALYSYSIFISGGLYCRIYAFYVHYPEEGNNNTLTLTFTAKFASIIIERSIVLKNYAGIKFEGVASFFIQGSHTYTCTWHGPYSSR